MSKYEVIVSFILLIAIGAVSNPATSSLFQVSEQFAKVARIVNAIALQNEFSSNMTNDFIAELLGFSSGNTVEMLARIPVDPNVTNARLEVIIGDVMPLGKNPVSDSSKIKDGFQSLEAMKGKVTDLENGVQDGWTARYEAAVKKISFL